MLAESHQGPEWQQWPRLHSVQTSLLMSFFFVCHPMSEVRVQESPNSYLCSSPMTDISYSCACPGKVCLHHSSLGTGLQRHSALTARAASRVQTASLQTEAPPRRMLPTTGSTSTCFQPSMPRCRACMLISSCLAELALHGNALPEPQVLSLTARALIARCGLQHIASCGSQRPAVKSGRRREEPSGCLADRQGCRPQPLVCVCCRGTMAGTCHGLCSR